MRRSLFLPGLIIMIVGLALLLGNLGIVHVDWEIVWQFWPVLLILAGIVLLLTNRRTWWVGCALVFILLAGVAALGYRWNWHFANHLRGPIASSQRFTEVYTPDVSARATFLLTAGAGNFYISTPTDQLYDVTTESNQGSFGLTHTQDSGVTTLNLTQNTSTRTFTLGRVANSATVHLNTNPLWDMTLKTGAASLDADLSDYKINTISLEAGASQVTLKLGAQQQELHGDFSTGAASLAVQVPQSVGCEVITDTGLSSKNLPGFTQSGSTYRTEGFEASSKKIYLTVKSGVSSITVSRY